MASNYLHQTGDAGAEGSRLPTRTAGASHPAHAEARAELRDRETYYAELRSAVNRPDEGTRDDNWTRDEMATPTADTWT